MPINPPAKPAPKEPNSNIEENIESSEFASQLTISVIISRRRPKLIVMMPEIARNPKNAAWAKAIIFMAFKDMLIKNAAVAPKKNPNIPFNP